MLLIPSKELSSKQEDAAKALLMRNLGKSYQSCWDSSETDVFVALKDQKIIGVGISQLASLETKQKFVFHIEKQSEMPVYAENFLQEPVGAFQAVAVDKNFRKQGVAFELTKARIQALKNRGCQVALVESWVTGSDDNSSHLYKKLGFDELALVPEYWNKDVENDVYRCSICKIGCFCSAILYLGKL